MKPFLFAPGNKSHSSLRTLHTSPFYNFIATALALALALAVA
jgi:hypothetical protein